MNPEHREPDGVSDLDWDWLRAIARQTDDRHSPGLAVRSYNDSMKARRLRHLGLVTHTESPMIVNITTVGREALALYTSERDLRWLRFIARNIDDAPERDGFLVSAFIEDLADARRLSDLGLLTIDRENPMIVNVTTTGRELLARHGVSDVG